MKDATLGLQVKPKNKTTKKRRNVKLLKNRKKTNKELNRWISCNKRMEWYKNKKAINSRALKNTCCIYAALHLPRLSKPSIVETHIQFHSLSIATASSRTSPAFNVKKKAANVLQLVQFNGAAKDAAECFLMSFLFHHRHIHRHNFMFHSVRYFGKIFFSATACNISSPFESRPFRPNNCYHKSKIQ